MARSGSKKTVPINPEVNFSLALRPITPAQAEAGKRLFKKLVARVQSEVGSGGRG